MTGVACDLQLVAVIFLFSSLSDCGANYGNQLHLITLSHGLLYFFLKNYVVSLAMF